MKKLFAIAFISILALGSCSQKETATETNTMLAEPEVTNVQDSPTKAYGDGSPLAPDSISLKPEPAATPK